MHRLFGFAISKSVVLILACPIFRGQISFLGQPAPANESSTVQARGDPQADQQAEEELRKGTALTRGGSFAEAIPHLLAARGHVPNEYAAYFNLALCYVGTGQFKQAIQILNGLHRGGDETANVENLLAQAYIGDSRPKEALAALQKAAALSPKNEKLYLFVADACMDHQEYALGLQVVDLALRNLPQSPRLHYERGIFLSLLDDFDKAKEDFAAASKLAPGSDIAYLSAAHEELFEGNISEAVRIAREGVKKGFENYVLLTMLGEALIRSGITPGQAEFEEAQTALEKSVAGRPGDPSSRIALGKLYLMVNRFDDAISQLEKARQLEPGNAAVYPNLARAYQRRGNLDQAQDALAMLAKLNQDRADRINSAPGDRKLGYSASGRKSTVQTAAPQRDEYENGSSPDRF